MRCLLAQETFFRKSYIKMVFTMYANKQRKTISVLFCKTINVYFWQKWLTFVFERTWCLQLCSHVIILLETFFRNICVKLPNMYVNEKHINKKTKNYLNGYAKAFISLVCNDVLIWNWLLSMKLRNIFSVRIFVCIFHQIRVFTRDLQISCLLDVKFSGCIIKATSANV